MFKPLSLLFILLLSISGLEAHAEILSQTDTMKDYSLVMKLSRKKTIAIKIDKANKRIEELSIRARRISQRLMLKDKKYIRKMIEVEGQPDMYYRALKFFLNYPLFKRLGNWKPKSILSSTDICKLKGQPHKGEFTFRKTKYKVTTLVGDKSNKCMGLCGRNCKNSIGSDIYTQECLNHDLCHRKTGSFFGCIDELLKASYGFFFGAKCKS